MASLPGAIGMGAQGASIGTAIAPGIGTIIGGVGGLIAGLFSDDGSDEARAALEKNKQIWANLQIPDVDKALLLQTYQQNGTLTPEMIQQLPLHADTKNVIKENPENRANQQQALNTLKQLSQSGMSAQDVAQMNELRGQTAGDQQAKTQQLLQDEAQRGQSGSGNTLAAQLMSQQAGNQAASKGAIDVAANAANARQQALMNFANLSGQVRGQDVGTEKYNMENELARQQFLDKNSLGRQTANIQATNLANAQNLERQQLTGDRNTSSANTELARQQQARVEKFKMEKDKAQGMMGLNTQGGALAQQQNANQAQGMQGMLGGLAGMATAGSAAGLWGPKASTGTTVGSSYAGANDINDAMNKNPGNKYAEGGRVESEDDSTNHIKLLGKIVDTIKGIKKEPKAPSYSEGSDEDSRMKEALKHPNRPNGQSVTDLQSPMTHEEAMKRLRNYAEGGMVQPDPADIEREKQAEKHLNDLLMDYTSKQLAKSPPKQYAEGGRIDRFNYENKEEPTGLTPFNDMHSGKEKVSLIRYIKELEESNKPAEAQRTKTGTISPNSLEQADKENNYAEGGRASSPYGDLVQSKMKYLKGGRVPGTPEFPGNDYRNDIVDAKLSKKEIVIPNTASDSPKKAKSFVDDVFKKEEKKSKKHEVDHAAILHLIGELHGKKK